MKFSDEQINFMRDIGIEADFNNLTDDDYIEIEEIIGANLQTRGFDKNYKATEIGEICESILDVMNG